MKIAISSSKRSSRSVFANSPAKATRFGKRSPGSEAKVIAYGRCQVRADSLRPVGLCFLQRETVHDHPQPIQPGGRPAIGQAAGPHDGKHALVAAKRSAASGRKPIDAGTMSRGSQGRHASGGPRRRAGQPTLRDRAEAPRPRPAPGPGPSSAGLPTLITSKPLCAHSLEAGIGQADEPMRAPSNRTDG